MFALGGIPAERVGHRRVERHQALAVELGVADRDHASVQAGSVRPRLGYSCGYSQPLQWPRQEHCDTGTVHAWAMLKPSDTAEAKMRSAARNVERVSLSLGSGASRFWAHDDRLEVVAHLRRRAQFLL